MKRRAIVMALVSAFIVSLIPAVASAGQAGSRQVEVVHAA